MGASGAQDREAVRTCAGCRERDHRSALLRFAVSDEEPFLAPDIGHRLGGRGVSVHPRRTCVSAAAERGGFSRALRRPVRVDAAALLAQAREQYLRRARGLILAARRNRSLALGSEACREAVRSERAHLLIVAADAQGRRAELSRAMEGRTAVLGDRFELGKLLGRDEVSVISILDAGIAEEAARALSCAAALSEDG